MKIDTTADYQPNRTALQDTSAKYNVCTESRRKIVN